MRIQRLQTLADLWGKLQLYSPALASSELDWDSVLVAAIPEVERAGTREEFVRVLNIALFGAIGDPLNYARLAEDADSNFVSDFSGHPRARLIAPRVGYIDSTDPALYWQSDYGRSVYDDVQRLGALDLLIVDVRFTSRSDRPGPPLWVGLWTGTPLTMGAAVSRLNAGYTTHRRWMLSDSHQLQPVIPRSAAQDVAPAQPIVLRVPTVFLTNLPSQAHFEAPLDALQHAGAAAIIFEQDGPFAEVWGGFSYPEQIRVRLHSTTVLSRSGGLGARPDVSMPEHIEPGQLLQLAQQAWAARRTAAAEQRPQFDFSARAERVYAVSHEPLRREERLLGLARMWHALLSFTANLEHASTDLSKIPPQWIREAEMAEDLPAYFTTLRRFAATLNDSHIGVHHPSVAWPAWGVPALLQKIEGRVIVTRTDPLLAERLSVGDEILAVDGRSIGEVEQHWTPLLSATHEANLDKVLWLYGNAIRGDSGTSVTLRARTNTGIRDVVLQRTMRTRYLAVELRPGPIVRELPDQIGYIDLFALSGEAALDSALTRLAHTRGMILDLRRGGIDGWQGEFGPRYGLVSRFMDAPVVEQSAMPVLRYMHASPPIYAWEETLTEYYPFRNRNGIRYSRPVVMLIDERVQSVGEAIAWPFHVAGRATFVGRPTAGTAGHQTTVSLPRGGELYFPIGRFRHLDGGPYHSIGIVPHVRVDPTVAGVRAGRDEILESGINEMQKQIANMRQQQ